jgi:MFS family permease
MVGLMENELLEHSFKIEQNLRHNFTVNVFDGVFFGLALGFASFVTIIPLFVSKLTNSAVLIGLVPAIHNIGWQVPQLFTARWVSRLGAYKSAVLKITLHERLPFFALALLALGLPVIGKTATLPLLFLCLIWQGLGGGFCANAWQSMVGNIIPNRRHGLFFGVQAASGNVMVGLGGLLSGYILEKGETNQHFALIFLLAGVAMVISWLFIGRTREFSNPRLQRSDSDNKYWISLISIMRQDHRFRRFIVFRNLIQYGFVGFGFYTVYIVQNYGVTGSVIGEMTGVFAGAQIVANVLMGWLVDKWGYRVVLEIGVLAGLGSALSAWFAPSYHWFYLAFILAGIANVTAWTIVLSMTLNFGNESERAGYVGLSHTLTTPSSILAPLIGGLLADTYGFMYTFIFAALACILSFIVVGGLTNGERYGEIKGVLTGRG